MNIFKLKQNRTKTKKGCLSKWKTSHLFYQELLVKSFRLPGDVTLNCNTAGLFWRKKGKQTFIGTRGGEIMSVCCDCLQTGQHIQDRNVSNKDNMKASSSILHLEDAGSTMRRVYKSQRRITEGPAASRLNNCWRWITCCM